MRDRTKEKVGDAAASAGNVPKLVGCDVELGNFFLGPGGTGHEAARALLREFEGVPAARGCVTGYISYGGSYGYDGKRYDNGCEKERDHYYDGGRSSSYGSSYSTCYDPQDWGRKFLPANGGCAYIDSGHLETCTGEVLSAHDFVAAWHGMLRLTQEALAKANARLPKGQRLQVTVSNSDGHGQSWGGHMNFLLARRCFENLFDRKLHHLLYLASYLVSSILYSGAGKCGSENGQPSADFAISQRADFCETLAGTQTMFNRPIVNSRDESHCGVRTKGGGDSAPAAGLARLHVIFFDSGLCHVGRLLTAGATQIFLAMVEREWIGSDLILDDPLQALHAWSHDPALEARARLLSRARYTILDMQRAIFERACRFVATGGAEGVVPRAQEIMDLWGDTLDRFGQGDTAVLASRVDWVLKRCILERAVSKRGLSWGSPEVKMLDHLYGSLDPSDGLYWAYERAGVVQKVVTDGVIERFAHEPPEDTRAWTRAQLLRRADPDTIESVDWDAIRFRFRKTDRRFGVSYHYKTLQMDYPLGFTRAECEEKLARAASVEEAVEALASTGEDRTDCSRSTDGAAEVGPLALSPAESADTAAVPTTDETPCHDQKTSSRIMENGKEKEGEGHEVHGTQA